MSDTLLAMSSQRAHFFMLVRACFGRRTLIQVNRAVSGTAPADTGNPAFSLIRVNCRRLCSGKMRFLTGGDGAGRTFPGRPKARVIMRDAACRNTDAQHRRDDEPSQGLPADTPVRAGSRPSSYSL
jgi:hypothetical protein